MDPLPRLAELGHEEVLIFQDAAARVRGVLAIHQTREGGAALAATRVLPALSIEEALADAVHLSEAVTREAAMLGLTYGGAAAVFAGEAAAEKSRPFLSAYSRVLERQAGRVYAVADMGFDSRDLTVLARMTKYVVHRRGATGDAAELTALGVLEGIRAAAARLETALDEIHVAVQGVGQVGYRLARLLASEGARLTVADVDDGRAERAREELKAEVVAPEEIAAVEADVFAPCAGSRAIGPRQVERFRGRAIVGAARGVLDDPGLAETLHERGILYAPDFVVSGGALAGAIGDDDEMAVQERVADVGTRLENVWSRARAQAMSPERAARAMLVKT